jgi:hypothetical protein
MQEVGATEGTAPLADKTPPPTPPHRKCIDGEGRDEDKFIFSGFDGVEEVDCNLKPLFGSGERVQLFPIHSLQVKVIRKYQITFYEEEGLARFQNPTEP